MVEAESPPNTFVNITAVCRNAIQKQKGLND